MISNSNVILIYDVVDLVILTSLLENQKFNGVVLICVFNIQHSAGINIYLTLTYLSL